MKHFGDSIKLKKSYNKRNKTYLFNNGNVKKFETFEKLVSELILPILRVLRLIKLMFYLHFLLRQIESNTLNYP